MKTYTALVTEYHYFKYDVKAKDHEEAKQVTIDEYENGSITLIGEEVGFEIMEIQ